MREPIAFLGRHRLYNCEVVFSLVQEEEVHLIRLRQSRLQRCLRKERRLDETVASARRSDFDRTTGAPLGQYKEDQIVWKPALRFCRFRCAYRVEELGNLSISDGFEDENVVRHLA